MIATLVSLALAQSPDDGCLRLHAPSGGSRFLASDVVLSWVVLDGGRVVATSALPSGAQITDGRASVQGRPCDDLDVSNATITPGFVSVGTRLGLVEIDMVPEMRDADAGGGEIRASLVVADAYNPASTLIPVARARGVTHAVLFPMGGQISGQAAFVRLSGTTQADAVVARSVAMVGSVGGPSKAGGLRDLAAVLDDTRLMARSRAAVESGATRLLAAHPRDLEALLPVVRGEVPLALGADRASDIEALLRFSRAQGIRLVIVGGAEAWRHADALAEARVAVVLDPTVFGPGGFSQVDARPDNAALLAAAGVDVILSNFDTHNARLLSQLAGIAVSRGMPRDDALAAVTHTPLRVFGQPGGQITVGAPADLVVWAGADPFELSTSVSAVIIGGRTQSLRSRQTELLDRYRELPGTGL